jgi:hypothetical protein
MCACLSFRNSRFKNRLIIHTTERAALPTLDTYVVSALAHGYVSLCSGIKCVQIHERVIHMFAHFCFLHVRTHPWRSDMVRMRYLCFYGCPILSLGMAFEEYHGANTHAHVHETNQTRFGFKFRLCNFISIHKISPCTHTTCLKTSRTAMLILVFYFP